MWLEWEQIAVLEWLNQGGWQGGAFVPLHMGISTQVFAKAAPASLQGYVWGPRGSIQKNKVEPTGFWQQGPYPGTVTFFHLISLVKHRAQIQGEGPWNSLLDKRGVSAMVNQLYFS